MSTTWNIPQPESHWQRGCNDAKMGSVPNPPQRRSTYWAPEHTGYMNGYAFGRQVRAGCAAAGVDVPGTGGSWSGA
jgi:hypothetical protein